MATETPDLKIIGVNGNRSDVEYNSYRAPVREIIGERGRRTFREMAELDPVVAAVLLAIEMMVRKIEWRSEPVDTTSPGLRWAEFVTQNMGDMSLSWSDFISEVLTMLVFGWSYFETVLKMRGGDSDDPTQRSRYDDSLIGWRKFDIRPQETLYGWEFDEEGGIQGMHQIVSFATERTGRVFIPIDKSVLFRTKVARGNPEGVSVLRSAFRPWWFKKHIENIEAIGIERDLAGLPVARIPAEYMSQNATPEQAAMLARIVKLVSSVRRDEQEGLVLPSQKDSNGNEMFDFKLLSSGGNRQFDTNQTIGRYDQRITMSVLADFVLLGHEKVGSFALSSDKTDVFAMAVQAWANNIADTLSSHPIPRLMRMNGAPVQLSPRIVPGEISHISLPELASFLTVLSQSGMPLFPDEGLESFLRKMAGLPQKSPDANPEPMPKFIPQQNPATPEQQQNADAQIAGEIDHDFEEIIREFSEG